MKIFERSMRGGLKRFLMITRMKPKNKTCKINR